MTAPRFTRRVRSVLRRDAQRLLTPRPPTEPLLPPVGPRVPHDARVQQVLDLCMGVGEVLLASGEGAGEATDTMSADGRVRLPAVDCDVTFTAITLCHRGMAAPPVTSMRLVRYRALDLSRLAAVYRTVDRVERGDLALRSAAEALREAVEAPQPYPRWVTSFGRRPARLARAAARRARRRHGGRVRGHGADREHREVARSVGAAVVLPFDARAGHRLALAAGVALGEFLTRPGRSGSNPARDDDRQ